MIRKFLLKLLVVASFPCVGMLLWCVFVIALDYRSYHSLIVLPDCCRIVICGNSQSRDALNPLFFPLLHNCSAAATTEDQNLLRLKDVLDANTGNDSLQYVLIDVNCKMIGQDERSVPLSDGGPERVHALLHFYHMRDSKRPLGSITRLVRDVVILRKFSELRKTIMKGRAYRSPLAGGFSRVQTCGFLEHPEKAESDAKQKADAFNSTNPFDCSTRLAEILRASCLLVREYGREPVFISTPISPMLMQKLDSRRVDAVTNGVATLARECGTAYFNYMSVPFPIDCWRDANHMNVMGAERFTRQFRDDFFKWEETGKDAVRWGGQ